MKDTIYVLGPKSLFDQRFEDYQNETGFYFESGFSNWGAIRHSLDGQLTILEEAESKFDPDDLSLENVHIYTHSLIKQYLKQHKVNWVSETEIYL